MLYPVLETTLQPSGSAAFTATVVIAGFGSVLLTLILLIGVFQLFGKTVSAVQERAARRQTDNGENGVPAPPVIRTQTPPPPPPIEEGVPPEIVAVITAAVYEAEGAGARIASVRRKKRPADAANPWVQAAVLENTKPF